MRLTETLFPGQPPIDGYGPGFFRIAGAVHGGPVLVLPAGVMPWAGLGDAGPLLAALGQVDVLLVGMGAEIAVLPGPLGAALDAAGIGVEPMATPAAARTYNVLLGEGRRVGAALIPV